MLISGGGDGAIQDFLLLATGVQSIVQLVIDAGLAREVHRHGQRPLPAFLPQLARFEREALSLEERCWRDYCWFARRDRRKKTRIVSELDSFYRGWLEHLPPKDLPAWRPGGAHIQFTLVRKDQHHSICYPLNRLMALIAERQFARNISYSVGELERQRYSPSDFDVAIIRHGIDNPGAGGPVRKQALPFDV